MGALTGTPGRKVTRRLEEPGNSVMAGLQRNDPGALAEGLAERHNWAVQTYGSNSGGWHAFDPNAGITAGVFDGGPFPDGTVVSKLAWGRITLEVAQRLLEADGMA